MTSKIVVSLFKKQLEFIRSKERNVHLDAGIGFGKTTVLGFLAAKYAIEYPETRWLIAARDLKQLRAATLMEFEWAMKNWLGMEENVHYNKVTSPQIVYTLRNQSTIEAVGAHNYDTVFRGGNYSGLFADEVDYWKPEAWSAAKGRIRKAPEIIRSVSSPNGYNHIWEDYFDKKLGEVITATSYDNPTLSNEYLESLKKSYSPRLFEQEVMAKRLRLNVGQVYNEFNRDKHVRPCKDLLTDSDQLYFFTDYNIANYCGVYLFFKNGKVYAWGEEHLKYKGTREMAENIKMRFPDRQVLIVGDSAGNSKRDTAADKTNYEIFEQVLGRGCTIKSRNPYVEQRIISANSNFYHDKVVIDPSCKTLVKDLELLAWKENGKDIEKTIDLSHASDAFTYGLWHFIPVKRERKRSRTIIL